MSYKQAHFKWSRPDTGSIEGREAAAGVGRSYQHTAAFSLQRLDRPHTQQQPSRNAAASSSWVRCAETSSRPASRATSSSHAPPRRAADLPGDALARFSLATGPHDATRLTHEPSATQDGRGNIVDGAATARGDPHAAVRAPQPNQAGFAAAAQRSIKAAPAAPTSTQRSDAAHTSGARLGAATAMAPQARAQSALVTPVMPPASMPQPRVGVAAAVAIARGNGSGSQQVQRPTTRPSAAAVAPAAHMTLPPTTTAEASVARTRGSPHMSTHALHPQQVPAHQARPSVRAGVAATAAIAATAAFASQVAGSALATKVSQLPTTHTSVPGPATSAPQGLFAASSVRAQAAVSSSSLLPRPAVPSSSLLPRPAVSSSSLLPLPAVPPSSRSPQPAMRSVSLLPHAPHVTAAAASFPAPAFRLSLLKRPFAAMSSKLAAARVTKWVRQETESLTAAARAETVPPAVPLTTLSVDQAGRPLTTAATLSHASRVGVAPAATTFPPAAVAASSALAPALRGYVKRRPNKLERQSSGVKKAASIGSSGSRRLSDSGGGGISASKPTGGGSSSGNSGRMVRLSKTRLVRQTSGGRLASTSGARLAASQSGTSGTGAPPAAGQSVSGLQQLLPPPQRPAPLAVPGPLRAAGAPLSSSAARRTWARTSAVATAAKSTVVVLYKRLGNGSLVRSGVRPVRQGANLSWRSAASTSALPGAAAPSATARKSPWSLLRSSGTLAGRNGLPAGRPATTTWRRGRSPLSPVRRLARSASGTIHPLSRSYVRVPGGGSSSSADRRRQPTAQRPAIQSRQLVRLNDRMYHVLQRPGEAGGRALRAVGVPPLPSSSLGVGKAAVSGHPTAPSAVPSPRLWLSATARRAVAGNAVQRSLAHARQRHITTLSARPRAPCPDYCLTGACAASKRGQCRHLHDPDKVAVCGRWLNGSCTRDACPLQHKRCPELMPVCSFFLEGICSAADCPYLHVNYSADAAPCRAFLRGFCPLGSDCPQRHITLKMARELKASSAAGKKQKRKGGALGGGGGGGHDRAAKRRRADAGCCSGGDGGGGEADDMAMDRLAMDLSVPLLIHD